MRWAEKLAREAPNTNAGGRIVAAGRRADAVNSSVMTARLSCQTTSNTIEANMVTF